MTRPPLGAEMAMTKGHGDRCAVSIASSGLSLADNTDGIDPVSSPEDDDEEKNLDRALAAAAAAAAATATGTGTGTGTGGPVVRQTTGGSILARVASRMTTRSLPEPPPPPDGGLQAWTQVAMGWLVIFTTWGYTNSFGSWQTYYTATLPQSASTISWIGSVQVWLTFVVGAFSGRLLDAGFFAPTFVVGAVLQLLGIFLMSVSTQYWQLMLTQGVLTGLGGGIFFCPSLALVGTYFEKRRALAVGLATTGNATGGMVYPILVRQLLPTLGFAWTARVLGFVNLASLALVFTLMRPRLPPRTSGPVVDMAAFREPVYVAFVGALLFINWAFYNTFYYIASFGTDVLHLSYSSASVLVILINGAGLPSRLVTPLFADRFGPLNTLVPITLVLTIVAYSWLAVRSTRGLYAFTTVYGLMSGAFQCLMPTTIASITPRLDMTGTRLGMAFTIISFTALTGPPLGGALQSLDGGGFVGDATWSASVTLLTFVMVAAARVFRVGWRLGPRC